MSRLSRSPFVLALFAVVGALAAGGCGDARTPLSPSVSQTSLQSAAGGGPSSYDANGPWFGEFFVGAQRIGEGTHIFTQSPSGNLTAVGSEPPDDPERDWRTYSFKRIGRPNGTVRNYRLTIAGQGPTEPCATDLSGHAQLNTLTNRIEGAATGVLPNCAEATISIRWLKQ